MTSPLVLGVLRPSARRDGAMASERIRALAAEAALQGAVLCLFGPSDIDFAARTVRYTRLTPAGWTAWTGPIPDVVLRGADDEDCPATARLATMVPVLNRPHPDRVAVSEALLRSELGPHVIPFRQIEPEPAAETIAAFLDEHQRVVLKPGRENTGIPATFVALDGGEVVLRRGDRHWRRPRAAGLSDLAALIGPDPWTIQKMIVSRVGDGRTFDIRVHAHKDGNGDWARVRSFVGLSEAGMLFSNASRGGYQGGLDKVLAKLSADGAALADRVRVLGLQTAKALDTHCGGTLVELEAVILVGPGHQPWIAGVRSEPVTHFHEFERAHLHVAYALHVAQRVGTEAHPGASTASGSAR